MVDEVKIGDEVETSSGRKVYVTYIQYSDRDGYYWYQGIEANGKPHIAIKSFSCHKTGRHSTTIEKWLLDEMKGE